MQKYNCKVCGAEIKWDPSTNSLRCDYCGTEHSAEDFVDNTVEAVEGNSGELDETYTSVAGTLADGQAVYKCSECGAEIVMNKTTMQTECLYCGRAMNVTEKTAGRFRAHYVIPFIVTPEQAQQAMKKHFDKFPLLPSDFSKTCKVENIKNLFVPYFLYEANAVSDGVVEGEKISRRRSGNTEYTKHTLYEIDLKLRAEFDNIPVDGSKVLDNAMMDGIEPFQYDKMQDFNPAYMAGYYAEQPDDNDDAMERHAKSRIKSAMDSALKDKAGKYDSKRVQSNVTSYTKFANRLTMMPVYLFNIKYKEKMYPIVVNGQTGKTSSVVLPGSKLKLAMWAGMGFGVMTLIQLFVALL